MAAPQHSPWRHVGPNVGYGPSGTNSSIFALSGRLSLATAPDLYAPELASFCRLSRSDWAVILPLPDRHLSSGWP